ncbi:ABC transporter ATP-binding protein [Brevibacterium sp. VCM10]|uniref:ABC transporter ATP-binding protein n=1 Tax=Brevibacterium sp. VCM10 TaxID=1381751 RepID=UPI0004BBDAF2|nr:ABC transporter ATP-binding protein [Brevibacterium sp. VCM10]
MSMLSVQGLHKSYRGTAEPGEAEGRGSHTSVSVLKDVSFDVEPGELFTLLGPSGCGKSTTLRSIAGLETPDTGEITISDRTVFSGRDRVDLEANRRQLSMVFQSYAIWPHLNVFKNVSFPLEVQRSKNKLSKKQIAEKVEAALDAVDLGGMSGRSATKMSGGQQQRLALARALVTEPELILLDEPLSNLDVKLRESMRLELKRLQQHLGLTSVYVTHDQGEALALSSRIAVMNKGEIIQVGTPREIYQDPNSLFVAQFVGTSNVLNGTVERIEGETAIIGSPEGRVASSSWRDLTVGDPAMLMIRPEDVTVYTVSETPAEANGWKGTVLAGAYIGEAVDYVVDVAGTEMNCRVDPREHGRTGTEAFLHVAPNHVHVLPVSA